MFKLFSGSDNSDSETVALIIKQSLEVIIWVWTTGLGNTDDRSSDLASDFGNCGTDDIAPVRERESLSLMLRVELAEQFRVDYVNFSGFRNCYTILTVQ